MNQHKETMTNIIETEVEALGQTFLIDLEIEMELVNDSFDHEFGTEKISSVEFVGIEVITVYNCNDEVVTDRATIAAVENNVNPDDYTDFDFDFEA